MRRFREDTGLSQPGTLARVEIDGISYFGLNSSAHPASLLRRKEFLQAIQRELGQLTGRTLNRVRALTHAEADALMQAAAGRNQLPKVVTILVDRRTCNFCTSIEGLPLLARLLGIKRILVVSPGRTIVIVP